MRKLYALLALVAVLGCPACGMSGSSSYPSETQKTDETPIRPRLAQRVRFQCDNKREFVFTIITGRAYLTFTDTSEVEALDENRINRGTEYANTHYILHEHAGTITLTDLTQDNAKPVMCQRQHWN